MQQGTGCWCCQSGALHSGAAATCSIPGWPGADALKVLEDVQGLHAGAAMCLFWLAVIDLLVSLLQDPKALEDLTGLTELHASTAAYDPDRDDSDNDAEPAAPTSTDADDDDVWTSI